MILVYLESSGSVLLKSSLAAISAALKIKEANGPERVVGILLGGDGVADAAKEASNFGLDEVRFVNDGSLERALSLTFSEAFILACGEIQPNCVVGASTSRVKDVFPRVAARLGGGQASDIVEVLPNGTFLRPMFAGNVLAEVEIVTAVKIITVRASAFDNASRSTSSSPVSQMNISVSPSDLEEFVSFDTVKSERPELGDAQVVVSGGRALKSKENFENVILPLADTLGGAVGASRAAVDSGYAPNDWQVGQTGKVVAPNLYIAVGISGAIQHLAGMKDSKVIVAINSDGEAPIFEVADYGLVGDLFQVVPELIAELKKAKA